MSEKEVDMENSKLKIKIGTHEFEAEGSEETVQKQYQMFLEAVKGAPAASPIPAGKLEQAPESNDVNGRLARLFRTDGKGITLTARLPESNTRDADTIILLLYGYKKLKGMESVYAPTLNESLRLSGYSVERVDRAIIPYTTPDNYLITRAGQKRGTQYRLTNKGETRAKELEEQLLNMLG